MSDDDKLTDEQAEAMLKRLSKHFKEPVLPMKRYCDGLRTWAEQIRLLNLSGRTYAHAEDLPDDEGKFGASYVDHLPSIMRDISKSNLLARILYGGEKLRTRPCPEHKGRWSGIMSCPYGCGETGWLPEPENRPSKQRIVDFITSVEQRKAKHRERWGDEYDTHFDDREIENARSLLAYLYPETPGTGVDAPVEPLHHLVFEFSTSTAYPRRQVSRLRVRLDLDPRLPLDPTGTKLLEVPFDAIQVALDLTKSVVEHLQASGVVYDSPHLVTISSLRGYAAESPRSGLTLAHASRYHDDTATNARKLAVDAQKKASDFLSTREPKGIRVTPLFVAQPRDV